MPSSSPVHIPIVISVVRQLQPQSILDVGVGFGKWGHLFREYLDICRPDKIEGTHKPEHWRKRIDGIEGYEPYITPATEYLYDNLYIGDMRQLIREVGVYDVIFLGDVIEHIDKADGLELLRQCRAHARQGVIVTTPINDSGQSIEYGNDLEMHRSYWTAADFEMLGDTLVKTIENTLLGVLLKRGVKPPICETVLKPSRPQVTLAQRVKRRIRRVVSNLAIPGMELPNIRHSAESDRGPGLDCVDSNDLLLTVNAFIRDHKAASVIEFMADDGGRPALLAAPKYTGLVQSNKKLTQFAGRYAGNLDKEFRLYGPHADPVAVGLNAELGLMLAPIERIVDSAFRDKCLHDLFACSRRFVILSSTTPEYDGESASNLVSHRRRGWKLARVIDATDIGAAAPRLYCYQNVCENAPVAAMNSGASTS